ncbi:hypothetical protein HMPREF3200_01848, partial [Anaerococcus tetradius]
VYKPSKHKTTKKEIPPRKLAFSFGMTLGDALLIVTIQLG